MIYLRYLWYVVRHRWFVMVECWRVGLYWRGFVHDWSKFLPSEFIPYARHFGPGIQTGRDRKGYYKPYQTGDAAFDKAWLRHMHRNDHHWQWWCQPKGDSTLHVHLMTWDAVLEMVADWKGASRAQRVTGTVAEWYLAHRDDIVLDLVTRWQVENLLGLLPRQKAAGEETTTVTGAGHRFVPSVHVPVSCATCGQEKRFHPATETKDEA